MIEYKQFRFPFQDTDCEGICRELNKLGKDNWLLVSPLHRVDSRNILCIMARDTDKGLGEAVGTVDTEPVMVDINLDEEKAKLKDWRGRAKRLGISLYHRRKKDVLAEIESKENAT